MQKVVLYIAMSLDGFIARENDDVSWLDPYQDVDEDYGYKEFMDSVGSAIMGSRTYLQALEHPERLLKDSKMYVLSRQQLQVNQGYNVEFFSGLLTELIGKIRKSSAKDIYVVGGGQVVTSLLNEGLLDEMRIFVIPIMLGQGITLFKGLAKETKLKLEQVVSYKSGIVQLRYSPVKT